MTHLNQRRRAVNFRPSILVGAALVCVALALSAHHLGAPVIAASSSQTNPVLASLPEGYRNWTLISVASVGSPVNDIRAKLGNDIAINAYRHGTTPFPDGAIIARLAWRHATDPKTQSAIREQAVAAGLSADAVQKLLGETFIAGPPTNIQFMVKDSRKWASTGGWGFAQFTNGKPDNVATQTCFACHAPGKDRDFVFTQYSP